MVAITYNVGGLGVRAISIDETNFETLTHKT